VKNLTKKYGKLTAVNSLSFDFETGQVYGILGPNGSGKTTTLAMLSDVIRTTSGEYQWFGNKMGSNQRHRIGIMLEKPNFYEYLSGLDNLKIVADIRGVAHSEIDDILKQIGLYERRKSRFKTYSLGMKQRLAIGATILGNPEVLILDEPTNGLDPEGIAEVRNLIKDLANNNKTIILASHLLDEVQKVCTQMLVLKEGNKIYEGSAKGLDKNSQLIEIKSDNISELKTILDSSTDFTQYEDNNNGLIVDIGVNSNSAILNSYVHSKGISLSFLSQKSESLEENILELLKSTK
ncbi:MAG: ATP-binding cassette domain-containing protein, partial [Bacteroidales bacterium]|nr:ATP-binding cassette domain-containing protein [Bacteroidales bacterium]